MTIPNACQALDVNCFHDLTFDTVNDCLKHIMHRLSTHQSSEIILDLQHVKQCDSAGLALLIELRRRCALLQKKLSIQRAPSSVVALAQFCGVSDLLEFN